jgi:hypothetical protein
VKFVHDFEVQVRSRMVEIWGNYGAVQSCDMRHVISIT